MTQVTLKSIQEFQNFKNMCNAHKQSFDFQIHKGLYLVTASTIFLSSMGY